MRPFLIRFYMGAAVVLFLSPAVYGQAKITLEEGRWVSVGGGIRSTFRSTEAPDSGGYTQDISLENARFYFNAQVHRDFLIEMNTEYSTPVSDLRILDAVIKYVPTEYFNIWMGRHLPPSDRANLDGPFFLSAYDYPGLVSRYPAIFAGRDNGVSVSGQLRGGVLKYAVGAYEGAPNVSGAKDNMLYATRLTYNFLDPEPGYYTSSTYYGDKDILAIAFVLQYQPDVVLAGAGPERFRGYNFDLLFEKKLPNNAGVLSLEGAFYDYDLKGAAGDGSAFLAQAGYLFPQTIGIGQLQPIVRHQDFRDDSITDFGVNYVMRGHSARVSFAFSRNRIPAAAGFNQFVVGTQFQF